MDVFDVMSNYVSIASRPHRRGRVDVYEFRAATVLVASLFVGDNAAYAVIHNSDASSYAVISQSESCQKILSELKLRSERVA